MKRTLNLPHVHAYGFTLVELAIVLVIIGLIIGGVVAGQDLIAAAQIRGQVTQLRNYETAYSAFRVKYNCIPGDCDKTANFFAGLANGNGNGLIENNLATYYDASGSVTWSASIEYQNFFITLARAGYIGGTFNTTPVIGQGLPALSLNKGASFYASDTRSFQVLTASSRNPDIVALRRGTNALWMVACQISGNSLWLWDDDCGIFKPIDVYNIDVKIDDGMPLEGRLFGFGGANSVNHCLTGARYDTQFDQRQCLAAYIID